MYRSNTGDMEQVAARLRNLLRSFDAAVGNLRHELEKLVQMAEQKSE